MAAMTHGLGEEESFQLRLAMGRYIRELREAAGLTQLELALRLDLPNAKFISWVETGRGNLSPARADEMADILGADRKEFATRLLRFTNPYLYRTIFGDDAELRKLLGPTVPKGKNTKR